MNFKEGRTRKHSCQSIILVVSRPDWVDCQKEKASFERMNITAIIVVDSTSCRPEVPKNSKNCFRPSLSIGDLVPKDRWKIPIALVQEVDARLIGLVGVDNLSALIPLRVGLVKNNETISSVFPEVSKNAK